MKIELEPEQANEIIVRMAFMLFCSEEEDWDVEELERWRIRERDERTLKCKALSAFEAFVDRVVTWMSDCAVDDSLLGDLPALAREARETIRGIRVREPPAVS